MEKTTVLITFERVQYVEVATAYVLESNWDGLCAI